MTRVLILGATGYIGGSVLIALKKTHPSAHFTTLVRSPADARTLEAAGAACVLGSFANADQVTQLTADADIVINTADCDDVALADALIAGLRRRRDAGKGVSALIHTSGSAAFFDHEKDGAAPSNRKIWSDTEDEIKSLTPDMMHVPVDIRLLRAGEEGVANTFIISPSAVYGQGSGPCNKPSAYYKFHVMRILAEGKGYVVGEGKNTNGTIHISDLVAVFASAFDAALKAESKLLHSSPYARYYFATVQDETMVDITTWIARALQKIGKIETTSVDHVAYEEAGAHPLYVAANMAPKGMRAAQEFGWVPKAPRMNAEIVEEDVKLTLASLPA